MPVFLIPSKSQEPNEELAVPAERFAEKDRILNQ